MIENSRNRSIPYKEGVKAVPPSAVLECSVTGMPLRSMELCA